MSAVTATSASRRTTRVATLVVATVMAVIAGLLGLAAPASAAIGTAGTVHTSVSCTSGRIEILPIVSVQSGYFNRQAMSYRFHLTGSNGYVGTWGWSGAGRPSRTARGTSTSERRPTV